MYLVSSHLKTNTFLIKVLHLTSTEDIQLNKRSIWRAHRELRYKLLPGNCRAVMLAFFRAADVASPGLGWLADAYSAIVCTILFSLPSPPHWTRISPSPSPSLMFRVGMGVMGITHWHPPHIHILLDIYPPQITRTWVWVKDWIPSDIISLMCALYVQVSI